MVLPTYLIAGCHGDAWPLVVQEDCPHLHRFRHAPANSLDLVWQVGGLREVLTHVKFSMPPGPCFFLFLFLKSGMTEAFFKAVSGTFMKVTKMFAGLYQPDMG